MRKLVVPALLFVASTASADRSTVVSLGLTGDARATGATYSDAGSSNVTDFLAGARLSLGFEDAPLAIPPPGLFVTEARLVPELFTGFLADDTHAEGYVGAGARLEGDIASNVRDVNMRTGIYVAGRGLVIGGHQDAAAELAIGEWLERGGKRGRFGWEGSVVMRPRTWDSADRQRELNALFSIYVGWH